MCKFLIKNISKLAVIQLYDAEVYFYGYTKYNFITEGKANTPFWSHRVPHVRCFRLCCLATLISHLIFCNLQNTRLQNIPKVSNISNLKITAYFDQQNETKNYSKCFLGYCQVFYVTYLILHNLQTKIYRLCRKT